MAPVGWGGMAAAGTGGMAAPGGGAGGSGMAPPGWGGIAPTGTVPAGGGGAPPAAACGGAWFKLGGGPGSSSSSSSSSAPVWGWNSPPQSDRASTSRSTWRYVGELIVRWRRYWVRGLSSSSSSSPLSGSAGSGLPFGPAGSGLSCRLVLTNWAVDGGWWVKRGNRLRGSGRGGRSPSVQNGGLF